MKRVRAGHRGSARGAPVWLFDLDNTLHHASHAIFPLINRAMTDYMQSALGLDRAQADYLRTYYVRRYGATLLGLARHHRIDPHDFLATAHRFEALAPLVRAERGLNRLLAALPGRKLLLTNGPHAYARALLNELGIAHRFERIIAIEHMRARGHWRAKPDLGMLRQTLRRNRINPRQAILVEDTREHLKRYKRLGLRTIWMVGHLPRAARDPDGISWLPGSGRPHYVDQRVRSLRHLPRGIRRGRGIARPLGTLP